MSAAARAERTLGCAMGYFEAHDAGHPPPPLDWGCPLAEAWVDARAGRRVRYETLADAPLTVCLEPDRATAEAVAEAAGLLCAHPDGRWLDLPTGELLLTDGATEHALPWAVGSQRVVWFVRPDVTPLADDDEPFDPSAPHHLLLLEPAGEARPLADLGVERDAYAAWHALQQQSDVDALTTTLDRDDPDGWRHLTCLYRLQRLGARAELQRLASEARRGLIAFVAGQLLTELEPRFGPSSLDGLPAPEPTDD